MAKLSNVTELPTIVEEVKIIKYSNGTQYWYLNGKLHREDGPAAIYVEGSQLWYLNGKLHREDGPAIIDADGKQHWYLNGVCQVAKVSP
jgi:hypothetical protein